MLRALCGLLGVFAIPFAYALTSETEPPMDKVSPTTVIVFLVVVAAVIVGFFWWNARRDKEGGDGHGKTGS